MSVKPLPRVATRSIWLAWVNPAMAVRRLPCWAVLSPALTASVPSSCRFSSRTMSCSRRMILSASAFISSRLTPGIWIDGPTGRAFCASRSASALASLCFSASVSCGQALDLLLQRRKVVGDAFASPAAEPLAAERERARGGVEAQEVAPGRREGVAARFIIGEGGTCRRGEQQGNDDGRKFSVHGVASRIWHPLGISRAAKRRGELLRNLCGFAPNLKPIVPKQAGV